MRDDSSTFRLRAIACEQRAARSEDVDSKREWSEREIEWHRDMLVDDQPLALELAVNVRDPNCKIDWLAFSVSAGKSLNAVAETHRSISSHAQLADFELQWSVEHAKQVGPVLRVSL